MEEALESSWRRRKTGTINRTGDKQCSELTGERAGHRLSETTTIKTAACGRPGRLHHLEPPVWDYFDRFEGKNVRLSSVSGTGGQVSNHSNKIQEHNLNKREGLVNETEEPTAPPAKEIRCREQVNSGSSGERPVSGSNLASETQQATGATDSNNSLIINREKKKHAVGHSRLLNALIEGHRSWLEQRTIIVDIKNGRRVIDNKKSLNHPENPSNGQHSETVRGAPLFDSLSPILNTDLNQHHLRRQENHTNDEDSARKSKTLAGRSSLQNNKNSGGRQAAEEEPTGHNSKGQQSDDKNSTKSKSGTILSIEQDFSLKVGDKLEGREEQEREPKGAEARRAEEAQANGKRPPTFGAKPYKLSRLPYWSYYGKARQVDLISAADRGIAAGNRDTGADNRSGGEEESSGSSGTGKTESASSSQRSLNSLAPNSRIPTQTTSQTKSQQQGDQQQTNSGSTLRRRFGYSNISNLFPGQPMNESRRHSNARRQYTIRFGSEERDRQLATGTTNKSGRAQSSSTANLNHQQQSNSARDAKLADERASRIAASASTTGRAQNTNAHYGAYATTRNRSLNSLNLSPISQSSDSGHNIQTGMRRQNSTYNTKPRAKTLYQGRPSSVAGYMGRHHRSPSTSSLHYGSAGLSPHRPAVMPIDPDCPVHGYSPVNGTSAVQSKSSHNLSGPIETADLLYDPYPNFYERPVVRQGSLYSPTSPPLIDGNRTISKGRLPPAAIGGDAYYNSASRFSMYHSPSVADGVRSSLAPPNEQLRRILGYQPHTRPIHLHPQWAYSRPFIHLQGTRSPSPSAPLDANGEPEIQPRFEPYNQLIDTQAIRAVDFHPSGEVYAIGSNSRALRICAYPADYELRHFGMDHVTSAPRILFKFLQVHRGSIYCVAFNATGQLLATGSNDQTVHIVRYNSTTHSPDGDEYRLTMHDGTVRDICFIDDQTNGSSILLSAGGGDNKIYVTDCDTITPFQSMAGHTQMVMALHHWSGANFVSASQDKTIRFWDLRTRACTSIISAPPSGAGTTGASVGSGKLAGPGAPVCSVKVDPSGRLLASGHSDSTCMLYDIRGGRIIQAYKPHDDEIRTVSFSPKSYYLLTGGYDGRIVLTDLQGDLTQPLPQCCVAESDDKIVQSKWHPSDFTFVTTSADKTATLWAMPTE